MTCVSLFELSDGRWMLYEGMDQKMSHRVGEFEDGDEALEAAKDERKDTILVIESGETGGYTRKLEKDGFAAYSEA